MGFWSKLKASLFGSKAAAPEPPPAATPAPVDLSVRETYGVTPSDPILCDQPSGEHLYIASLRCPHGHRVLGPRRGSMSGKCSHPAGHVALIELPGMNPAEMCLVDCYDLRCEGGEYSCTLYFDMYHPDPPPQPAPRGMARV